MTTAEMITSGNSAPGEGNGDLLRSIASKNEFSMFLSPVFSLCVSLTLWGGLRSASGEANVSREIAILD